MSGVRRESDADAMRDAFAIKPAPAENPIMLSGADVAALISGIKAADEALQIAERSKVGFLKRNAREARVGLQSAWARLMKARSAAERAA